MLMLTNKALYIKMSLAVALPMMLMAAVCTGPVQAESQENQVKMAAAPRNDTSKPISMGSKESRKARHVRLALSRSGQVETNIQFPNVMDRPKDKDILNDSLYDYLVPTGY
jgi:hypothetical protein